MLREDIRFLNPKKQAGKKDMKVLRTELRATTAKKTANYIRRMLNWRIFIMI